MATVKMGSKNPATTEPTACCATIRVKSTAPAETKKAATAKKPAKKK